MTMDNRCREECTKQWTLGAWNNVLDSGGGNVISTTLDTTLSCREDQTAELPAHNAQDKSLEVYTY